MNATLDGLTFVGDDAPATYTIKRDGGLTGWFDGVEVRHETVPRPNSDGDFDAPGYLGPRLITLSGKILAADAAGLEAAMKALEDLLADGSKAEFAVTQASGDVYTAQVRRHGAVEIINELYGSRARYRLQLWAPDPAKVLVP